MSSTPHLLVIAVNNLGHGLSGGDRLWVNLCQRWRRQCHIYLLGVPESFYQIKRHGYKLSGVSIDRACQYEYLGTGRLIWHQLKRTLKAGIYILKNLSKLKKYDYILSVSDFYPDLLSAFLLKLMYPHRRWIASFYLFAPHPLDQNSPYNLNHQSFKGWLYYLSQIPSRFIVEHFADYVLVTSQPDKHKFTRPQVVVVRGGVNPVDYQKYRNSPLYRPPATRKYLACYLGRLHVQKGVMPLIDIWKIVTKKIPNAKLAIIGNGQLESELRNKIKKYHLENNIELFGFLEGTPKIEIFQNSQMILHPAIYDSGGMAAAEGLSWGLPGVSFDLDSLKTYYPQGFLKVPCFNDRLFAKAIIKLSTSPELYQQLSAAGLKLISDSWTWSSQSKIIYRSLFSK